jgi:hypothetical protein
MSAFDFMPKMNQHVKGGIGQNGPFLIVTLWVGKRKPKKNGENSYFTIKDRTFSFADRQ